MQKGQERVSDVLQLEFRQLKTTVVAARNVTQVPLKSTFCTTGPSIFLPPPSESPEEQSPVTHETSSEHSRVRCSELCHKHWRRLQGQNKGPNEDSKAWDKWIMHHI